METHTRVGVMKEETFLNTRKPCHQQACEEFWNLRGQHNREEKKSNPQNTRLTTTLSREVAQMLVSVSSKGALNREARVACLG